MLRSSLPTEELNAHWERPTLFLSHTCTNTHTRKHTQTHTPVHRVFDFCIPKQPATIQEPWVTHHHPVYANCVSSLLSVLSLIPLSQLLIRTAWDHRAWEGSGDHVQVILKIFLKVLFVKQTVVKQDCMCIVFERPKSTKIKHVLANFKTPVQLKSTEIFLIYSYFTINTVVYKVSGKSGW